MPNVTSLCDEKLALGNGGMEIMEYGNLGRVAAKVSASWQGPALLNCHLWCPTCPPYDFSNISFNHTLLLRITK